MVNMMDMLFLQAEPQPQKLFRAYHGKPSDPISTLGYAEAWIPPTDEIDDPVWNMFK